MMALNLDGPESYPMTSLYVGDLHPEITEAMLLEKFSTAGPVLSVRVCRDMITRCSLGYAYVNFQHHADAERALDTINSDTINGRPIKIMWSFRNSGIGKVFIKNLDKSTDNKALYDTFSTFGNILSCKIVCDEHGSRGYGFVHFETEEDARNAIEKVNGMLLNGKNVFVGRFMNKRERLEMMGDEGKKFTNVYVKHLSEDVDDDGLQDMFEPYGKITSAKVMTTFDGKKRGFGFVNFEETESAERAVEELNGKELRGKVLFVGRAKKKAERQAELINRYQGVNVYVKNLDDVIDDERLRKEFSQFGTITSARAQQQQAPTKDVVVQGQEPLTSHMMASAPPQEQKQMLSERLLPLIQRMYPDLAGKINGMLLEKDNSELLHMLESSESLKAKVDEAVAVLQDHQAKETAIQQAAGKGRSDTI